MSASSKNPYPPALRRTRTSSPTTGFSLVELLVVISIIIVLMGILLVAMGPVQDIAKKMTTTATMRAFANAAEAFQMEHGQYPGVIPDAVLAADPKISTTENALLQLMGGYRVFHRIYAPDNSGDYASFTGTKITFDLAPGNDKWELKFDPITFGEGPIIKGKPHTPYMTADDNSLAKMLGTQIGEPSSPTSTDGLLHIPDLLDGWGQPIIYLRQQQKTGILCGAVADRPQFVISSAPGVGLLDPYLKSTQLGELGEDQSLTNPLGKYSILNATSGGGQTFEDRLAMICQSPALYDTNDLQAGTARGAFALISAGSDGIYFSRMDGPGSPAQALDDIANPDLVKEYDDVILFGGG